MRRSTAICLVVGLLLLVGSPTAWYVTRPATAVGDAGAFAAPATSEEQVTQERRRDPSMPDAAEGMPQEAEPAGYTTSELRGALVADPDPDRVVIPALGVEAAVVPVGLEADGTMEIPEDVSTVGWFEPGVRPGAEGSAVLAGHVDSRQQGPGAFFGLGDLTVGDEVTIEAGDGAQRWVVVARDRFAKEELPIADLFTPRGEPQLVLITCGGSYDPALRSYSDNVVVIAVPAP